MASRLQPPHEELETKDRRLCSRCVGEEFLKKLIIESGRLAKCFYCRGRGKTWSIDEIADSVEVAFEHHYERTATEPTPFEYAMLKDAPYGWDRPGEPVVEAIAGAAEIELAPAEDVREVLGDRHEDRHSQEVGEECEFDSEAHYEEKGVDDGTFVEEWRSFERALKSETRFFSRYAEATLAQIFAGLHSHKTASGKSVVVVCGPKKKIASLYRARVFQANHKLQAALMRPDLEIGPPSQLEAVAGRMNPRGIAVFYGATSPRLAVAEIRCSSSDLI